MQRTASSFRLALGVHRDLEAILTGARERHVEHEHRGRFDFGDARWRLGKIHRARAAQELRILFVHQFDLHLMLAHFGAPALESQHEVQARVHRRKLRNPDVLEDAEHGHLARLVDQRVIGDHREVEMHYFFATGTE